MFQDYDFQGYIDAYSFIEFSSGQTIINILKTERIMRMVYDRLFEKYNISEPKFFVILLLSIHEADGMPLIELGKNMMVSRANMTTLIDRMIKEDLVEKRKNADDKRSIKAHLTPKGRQLFDEIKENLKLGIPYPKARENALKAISKVDLSTTSNDILGLEYTKQLILQKSSIKPHTIKRTGSTYNSIDLVGQICSATAIRKQLKTTLDINLQNFVPLPTYAMLEELVKLDKIIHDESFFECIRYNIICNLDRLSDIFDVNEGLHNKIYKAALTSSTLDELASSIKSKRFTYTRIKRILFNILLEITKSDMNIIINTTSPAPYVRVLAFNQKGTELLNLMKKTSSIPIINKVSAFTPETELQRISFNYDTKATRIYNLINRTSKKAFDLGSNLDQDYYKSPVFIK